MLLLAAGCAGACTDFARQSPERGTLECPRVGNSPASAEQGIEGLLAYYDSVRALPKEELNLELAQARQRVSKVGSNFSRIQLALLLTLPNAGVSEAARGLALLDELSKEPADLQPSLRSFAAYLHAILTAQARQEESLQSLAQRLKDEQRRAEQIQSQQPKADDNVTTLMQKLKDEQRRAELSQAKQDESIANLTQKLREEQKRGDTLQQKLDALSTIEKSILERNQNKTESAK
jgi:hypothetical protein